MSLQPNALAYKDYLGQLSYIRKCKKCGNAFSTYDAGREVCHDCA